MSLLGTVRVPAQTRQPDPPSCSTHAGLQAAAGSFLQTSYQPVWGPGQDTTAADARHRWWHRSSCTLESWVERGDTAVAAVLFDLWYEEPPTRRERTVSVRLERPRSDTTSGWRVRAVRVVEDTPLSFAKQILYLAVFLGILQLALSAAVWAARFGIPFFIRVLGEVASGFGVAFGGSPPTTSFLVNLLIFGVVVLVVFLPAAVLGNWWFVAGFVILLLFPLIARAGPGLVSLTIVLLLLGAAGLAFVGGVAYFNALEYMGLAVLVQVLAGTALVRDRVWWRGLLLAEALCLSGLLLSLIGYSATQSYRLGAVAGLLPVVACALVLIRGPTRRVAAG